MRVHEHLAFSRASLFALATLSAISCTTETSQSVGTTEQAVVNPPLPSNLNLILNAKTTVTVGAFTNISGDVGSGGLNGSVLFDVSSSQGFGFGGFNLLANKVTVNTGASVGHVFGNDITINGFASQQSLGLDPTAMPQVPTVTAATPGTTNVSTNQNQARQLCPGQYGAISLGVNSTLNLNGGVYQVTRLTLADGARLEPSEPVVILVSGGVTTGIGAVIRPSAQSLNPMTAADIRIETGGAVTLGDSTQIRAHLLVTGKFATGKSLSMTGAAWAKTINIGTNGFISGEGVFSAQAPSVPPPCNDNNACTADVCVGSGTAVAFCRNTPIAVCTQCGNGIVEPGEECDDGNTTDGDGCSSSCTLPQCGNGVLEPGEEVDPPSSPSQVVPVSDQTCRFDFSAITQLYCNGTCGTWGGSENDCQQRDADAFCKLKTGNPDSTAISFVVDLARAAPGICCPTISGLGCTELPFFTDRGVQERVSVHETDLLSTHGPGLVVADVVCTP